MVEASKSRRAFAPGVGLGKGFSKGERGKRKGGRRETEVR